MVGAASAPCNDKKAGITASGGRGSGVIGGQGGALDPYRGSMSKLAGDKPANAGSAAGQSHTMRR